MSCRSWRTSRPGKGHGGPDSGKGSFWESSGGLCHGIGVNGVWDGYIEVTIQPYSEDMEFRDTITV